MIKNIGIQQPNIQPNTPEIGKKDQNLKADEFKGVLNSELSKNQKPIEKTSAEELLKFSSHALERIQHRGIRMMKEDVEKLNEAVERASKKGSKDALVVMGENAFIVSVKNKTVVTAMDKSALKENVFTNIDSTVFA